MVRRNGHTRFLKLEMSVILTQTDTTVGFLSQNSKELFEVKSRDDAKPFLKVYSNFKNFLNNSNRVPSSKKKLIRRAKKTTFIVKNQAFRVSTSTLNSQVLRELTWSYSTSANESTKKFDREFCEAKADIIIENSDGLSEKTSSTLLKINNSKTRRLR